MGSRRNVICSCSKNLFMPPSSDWGVFAFVLIDGEPSKTITYNKMEKFLREAHTSSINVKNSRVADPDPDSIGSEEGKNDLQK